jgi:cytochrome c biogenesis protein CcdA
MSYMLGMLMFMAAGALLHDVPFLRYISAMLLISTGTIFMILGRT